MHGIWRGREQMQQCAMFVHDLFCVMLSRKHNGWQQRHADIHLVFTNSHESEGILWAKGFPSVSYLKAMSVFRWEKLLWNLWGKQCEKPNKQRVFSRRSNSQGDQSQRYKRTGKEKKKKQKEKKEKKKPKENSLFLNRRLQYAWFKKPLKVVGFRAKLKRSKDTAGKGRFILVFYYFYCLT